MSRPRLLDLFCGAGGCSVGYHRAGFDVVGVDLNPMPRYPFEFHQGDALEYLAAHGHEFDAIHASPPCQAYCSLKGMPNAKKHPELVDPCRKLLAASGKPWVIENVMGAPLIRPTMLCGTMFGLGTGDADLRRHRIFETNWPLVLQMGMFCKHGARAGQSADPGELFGDGAPSGTRTICVIGQRGIAESCGDRKRLKRTITVTGEAGVGRDDAANKRRKTITVAGAHGDAGLSIARRIKRPGSVDVYGKTRGYAFPFDSRRNNPNQERLLYFSTAERNEAMGIDWMKGGEISQAIPPAYTEFIGRQLLAVVLSRKAVPA